MSERGLTLRPARAEDSPACAAILNRWIDATPWTPRVYAAEAVRKHYREHVIPNRGVRAAGRDGEVAGYLAVDEGAAEITSFYARDPGHGIGAALMAAAKADRARLSLWTFQANRGARRFYLREGFREGDRTEGDNEEGLPDVQYLWESRP